MAKKHKKTSAKRAKSTASGNVRTGFMSDFVAEFIRSPRAKEFKWPSRELPAPAVLAEFQMIMDVLMRAGYLNGDLVADGTNALRDRLVNFLQAQDWPRSTPIPRKWEKIKPTVRLIEVAVIADGLLEAINFHPTVAGSGWPPHPLLPIPRPRPPRR
jgi:hypothetical protein